ncbi:MAG: beta-phosphoglucomutase [Saprospiraceae bacterium]|nr:beta-phosphoglucomutase [Saprospiraceae bacterium]
MKIIEAFIFDLDGIIVDTTHHHYASWKILAKSFNYDFREEDNEQLKGANRMTSLNILLALSGQSFSEQDKGLLCEKKNNIYLDMISNLTRGDMLPGVYEFILNAKTSGLKIGMASSSKNARATLNRLKIDELFDAMLDANDILRGKPFPDVYLKVSDMLVVKPQQCLVFEDAFSGIKAAKEAGMRVVGMGQPAQVIQADLTIDSFVDLDPTQIMNIILT